MPAYSIPFGASDGLLLAKNLQVPATVVLFPGAGCTVRAQWSATPDAFSSPQTANWTDFPAGTVSVQTWDSLVSSVQALRFQRVTGSASCVAEVSAPE